ncbi:MAG: enoyl-CoA hydratase/isomerase family protein [Bacteriovoracaceae bacterium]|nr:enoyl-CoA hydratase/isomerase family protein [Bacteriovoracaceae bacterium]
MSLFNYQTLEVKLEKSTRTLFVTFKNQTSNYVNLEMLFELESLMAWTSNKVEIRSIFFKSNSKTFSDGFNPSILPKLKDNQIIKINEKLQKIVHSMFHLPQTIIFDLGFGASNIGCELSLGADIRIAHKKCSLNFNHTNIGLNAGAGGMGLLASIVGPIHARNWLLSGKSVNANQLGNTGFVLDFYESHEESAFIKEELLDNIYDQAPVARIQTKLGLLNPFINQFEFANKSDRQISKATLTTGDWKHIAKEDEPIKAKSMSYGVKLTLVKDETPSLPN